MSHNSGTDKRPGKIRRMCGIYHQPPDQKSKNQNHQRSSQKSCLLTDDRKNHIVLRLRNKSQFLQTASQTFSKNSSAPYGV